MPSGHLNIAHPHDFFFLFFHTSSLREDGEQFDASLTPLFIDFFSSFRCHGKLFVVLIFFFFVQAGTGFRTGSMNLHASLPSKRLLFWGLVMN